jgi:hypothetical protein
VEVYRHQQMTLHLIGTLREDDLLESPLLPGFAHPLRDLFDDMPV